MKSVHKAWLVVLVALPLISCGGGPASYTDKPLFEKWDRDTEYRIDDTADGFTVTSYTSEFQVTPDRDAVFMACKSAIMSIAYDVSERRRKRIQPIDDQQIRISVGQSQRNGVSGETACSAQLQVTYAS